jgi:dimethylargininase
MTRIALTRPIPSSINRCEVTHVERQPIDVDRARRQHDTYEAALRKVGCTVEHLPPLDEMPDSVFVEDIAVVLPEIAVITRPGAESRRGETTTVAAALSDYRPLAAIEEPGTLDGGDVLVLGHRIVIGLSARTNRVGITQFERIVAPFGYRVESAAVTKCLHLKSAVTSIGESVLLNPDWTAPAMFSDPLCVDPAEPEAANALFVNNVAIFPAAFARTRQILERRGIFVEPVPADELAKAEGGVTCCSIVFET